MRRGAGSGAARDARYALRQMRRAPLLTGALLLALAGGTGAGAASLSLARRASERPVPGRAPEGVPIPVQSLPVRSYAPGPADAVPPGPVPLGGPADEDQVLPRGIRSEMEESIGVLAGTTAGIAGLILALGVATTALLMLSRSSTRRGEMAMRGVLGATPRRVLGQVGVEGGVLGMLGLGAGAAVGWGWVAFMRRGAPSDLAVWLDHPWSLKVLALAAGLPLLAVFGFAAVPALAALGHDLHARVAGGARATAGPGAGGVRRALTVLAVGSSFALLCSAILLLRGFADGGAARQALDARDTLVAHLSLGSLPTAERAESYEKVLSGIAAQPGIRAESIASQGAWVGLGTADLVHAFSGSPVRPGIMRAARYHAVSPGYFRSLGLPLVSGREFTSADRSGARAVVVVNESFAHSLYPYLDPIGRHVQLGGMGSRRTWYTVVGVVRDPRPMGIGATTAPPPAIYLSLLQAPPPAAALAVRTAGNPLDTLDAVERVVHEAAPRATVSDTGTMEEALAAFSAPLSWFGTMFAALAAFTTLLAAMGLYGVVAHQVERRRRELGIRMALGARGRAVVGMVVGEGLRVTLSGLVLGVAGALCLGRLLQFFFPAVRLGDPTTFAVVGLLITAVSVLAAFIPARAAARVDPAIALRAE